MIRHIGGQRAVVVGGGLVGCAVAREAARRKAAVTVVERGEPCGEASRAAAGMLSPLGESPGAGPFLRLALESLRAYPGFVAALAEESGTDLRPQRTGKLLVAFDEAEERGLRERHAWQTREGLDVSWLEGEEARRLAPGLARDVRCGLLLADDSVVDNRRLGTAAWKAAEGAGARFLLGHEAFALETEGGRARGVRLVDGTLLEADVVVVAAGAWSGGLRGLPRPLPVRPVRGQMLSLAPPTPPLPRILHGGAVYLVPRSGDPEPRWIVGSTMEEAGFRKHTTPEALERLRAGAVRLLPSLARARVAESWAGLRPATPDGLPVLGPDPDVEGLLYATGHFRNGILLAPATARLMGLVLEGEVPEALAPFLPGRPGLGGDG